MSRRSRRTAPLTSKDPRSNKTGAANAASLSAIGQTPIDFLMSIMRDPTNELGIRLEAAKAVLSFVHPRYAVVEQSQNDFVPLVERLAYYAREAREASASNVVQTPSTID
jgi:hypothetical protein